MTLTGLQEQFAVDIAALINYAASRGYGLTFGDAYRDPRLHGAFGHKDSYSAAHSVHKVRLAVDFNLFIKGKYITTGDHPAYVDLGEQWESLGPHNRWGGRFDDPNHFSYEFRGYK